MHLHGLIKTFKMALSFSLLSLFLNRDQFLKEIDCSQDRKLFPLTVDPDEKKNKSHKLFLFIKMVEKHEDLPRKKITCVSG